MTINGEHTYFWQRPPAWVNRVVLGSLVPAAVIGLMVGGLTWMGWKLADSPEHITHYSLSMHVIAMLALSILAVAVGSALVVQRKPVLAGVVLIATAFGPMTIVATPIRASLITSTYQDTRIWWHVVVAGALTIVLSAWTWWVVRCLPEPEGQPDRPPSALASLLPDLVFIVSAAGGLLAYLSSPDQSNQPAMRAMVGWAILAAGIVTAVGFARHWWTSLVLAGGAGVVLGLIFLAYSRNGGWPGVAGWEYQGMESPIITSVGATAAVLSAWLLGLVVWFGRRAVSRLLESSAPVSLIAQD
jgi:hypothetical protein